MTSLFGTAEGVDFSYARPGGATLVAAGKRFVIRYATGAGGKAVTAQEIVDYRRHGLAIAFVFEGGNVRALGGHTAGVADASAADLALSALGVPSSVPIYFAVDFDANTAQYPLIDAYLAGAASVIGAARVGVYGHMHVVTHCAAAKTARWFWQTYAWSSGALFSGAHLYQYSNKHTINGGEVDYDRALRAAYGQWAPPAPPDTSTSPTPAPHFAATVTTATNLWNPATHKWVYNGRNAVKVGTKLVIRGAQYVKGGVPCYPIVGPLYAGYFVPVAHVHLGAKVP